jgi:hypothetical protein
MRRVFIIAFVSRRVKLTDSKSISRQWSAGEGSCPLEKERLE